MSQFLSTSWGRNVFAALLAAILFVLLGLMVGTPPAVSIFAGAIFGGLLVLIVQFGQVIWILASARGTPADVGANMLAEVDTPAGQRELNQMSFISLFCVAVVQELYVTLFKRDRPIWAVEFLGIGEGQFPPVDYGWYNRYVEWGLMIVLLAFAGIAAVLFGAFGYALGSPASSTGLSASGLVCGVPIFFIGFLVVLPVGLFGVSVIRRLLILYSMRAQESVIK
ncbi:MAG: hypothetical protein ACM3JD_18755 [Rudaea sp.]